MRNQIPQILIEWNKVVIWLVRDCVVAGKMLYSQQGMLSHKMYETLKVSPAWIPVHRRYILSPPLHVLLTIPVDEYAAELHYKLDKR